MRKSFGSKLVEQSNRRSSNTVRVAIGALCGGAAIAAALAIKKSKQTQEINKSDFSDKAKEIIDKNIIAMKYLQDK